MFFKLLIFSIILQFCKNTCTKQNYYEILKSMQVNSITSQTSFIKSLQIRKLNCIGECNKLSSCKTCAFVENNQQDNCFLFNKTISLNETVFDTMVDLYVKKCKYWILKYFSG